MRHLKIQRLNAYPEPNIAKPKTRLKAIAQKDMTILNCIERIVNVMMGKGLDRESFKRAERYIKYVAEKQNLTPMQTVFMALFINLGDDNCITIRDLCRCLGCQNVTVLARQSDIEALEKRWIIRKTTIHHATKGYRLNDGVMEAFAKNEPYSRKSYKADDIYLLFSFVFKLTHARHEEEIDTEELIMELNALYDENADMPFIQGMRSLGLSDDSMIIISQMCRHLVNNGAHEVMLDSLTFLFDKDFMRARHMRMLQNGSHELIKKGLIDFSISDGYKNRGSFMLTDKARKTLFGDIKLDYHEWDNDKRAEIIKCDLISVKPLIFNNDVAEQYERLRDILNEENYRLITSRLEKRNMRKGMTVLLYGMPGTGKTEAVKQIARYTGRDIMLVNISQMRSMWVGQSEKNIKAIFDNYKDMCIRSSKSPILLFNEADAIIGTRNENVKNPVGKMENTMQNIILQEMEDFEGILIATTNLAANFDKAFERRFLYKIEFTQPNEEARKALWLTIMPNIDDYSADVLSKEFRFSGGQIENVARKSEVDAILYGNENTSLEQIRKYCMSEAIGNNSAAKVGFLS